MKIAGALLIACTLLMACQQKDNKMVSGDRPVSGIDPADSTRWTEVQWVNETYDFGKVNEGPKVEVTFQVKNVGKKPLTIISVEKTCGCTETKRPENNIMPGETGTISATFDSNGRPGLQHKTINVVFNGKESPKALTFTGEVIPKTKQ